MAHFGGKIYHICKSTILKTVRWYVAMSSYIFVSARFKWQGRLPDTLDKKLSRRALSTVGPDAVIPSADGEITFITHNHRQLIIHAPWMIANFKYVKSVGCFKTNNLQIVIDFPEKCVTIQQWNAVSHSGKKLLPWTSAYRGQRLKDIPPGYDGCSPVEIDLCFEM